MMELANEKCKLMAAKIEAEKKTRMYHRQAQIVRMLERRLLKHKLT